MRIAQVAPLIESIPPKIYGGTERIVSFLTEELVKKGHDVTLYASGDSVTTAKLIPLIEKAFRLNPCCNDSLVLHILQLERLFQDYADYDIVHFHTDYGEVDLEIRRNFHEAGVHVIRKGGEVEVAILM
jgi:glycosyltransferase involved in cell wall biosynthesis